MTHRSSIGGQSLRSILTGTYDQKVMPALRVKGARGKDRKRYYRSQGRVGAHMLQEFGTLNLISKTRMHYLNAVIEQLIIDGKAIKAALKPGSTPLIKVPFTFGLALDVPACKSKKSPNYGGIPANVGDGDNVRKAMLDAAKRAGLIGEDNMGLYRGAVPLHLGLRDPIVVSTNGKWKVRWGFFAAIGSGQTKLNIANM